MLRSVLAELLRCRATKKTANQTLNTLLAVENSVHFDRAWADAERAMK